MEPAVARSAALTNQARLYASGPERRRHERRRATRFMFRERRSGYERRDDPSRTQPFLLGSFHAWHRSTPWLLPTLLVFANLLSLADILLTMRVLEAGAVEINPLLRVLMEFDVRVAAAVKASLVAGATLLIWRYRGYRKIVPLALLSLALFGSVVIYQGIMLLGA